MIEGEEIVGVGMIPLSEVDALLLENFQLKISILQYKLELLCIQLNKKYNVPENISYTFDVNSKCLIPCREQK